MQSGNYGGHKAMRAIAESIGAELVAPYQVGVDWWAKATIDGYTYEGTVREVNAYLTGLRDCRLGRPVEKA